MPSFFATAIGVVYLRFAPRLKNNDGEDSPRGSNDDLEDLRKPLNPSNRASAADPGVGEQSLRPQRTPSIGNKPRASIIA